MEREKVKEVKINRVLFVNHNVYPFEHTGTPITTYNHAIGIINQGIEVAVLIPSINVREHFTKDVSDGFILYQVPRLDKFETFFKNLNETILNNYIFSIIRIIEDFQPDIVHINDYVFMPDEILQIFSQSGAYVIRNVCNIEEICHLDSPVYFDGVSDILCSGPESEEKCARCFLKNVLKKNENEIYFSDLEKYSAKIQTRFASIKHHYKHNVDGVFFTSPDFKNYFKKFIEISDDVVSVIPRGFKFNRERKSNHKKVNGTKINVGFLGSLIPIKGIDLVLTAFSKISSADNFCLNIYGTGASPSLLSLIQQLEKQFPEKIIFHGTYNNSQIESIAENLDFALVPSNFDTFNRIVRELMFFGVPLIVTDFFGASIIENNVNGIKIKIGDAGALADSMKYLLENPAIIEKLSKCVMNTPIASLENEINGIYNFYKTIIDSKRNKSVVVNQYDLLLKAEALIEQNKLEEAKKLLKKIVVSDNNFIDAMNDLSVVHIMLEEYPDAIEQIKIVLTLDPQNEIAIGNIQYLESLLKHYSNSELQKV